MIDDLEIKHDKSIVNGWVIKQPKWLRGSHLLSKPELINLEISHPLPEPTIAGATNCRCWMRRWHDDRNNWRWLLGVDFEFMVDMDWHGRHAANGFSSLVPPKKKISPPTLDVQISSVWKIRKWTSRTFFMNSAWWTSTDLRIEQIWDFEV